MPRNRRLRRLANLLRILGLGAVALAITTAVVWRFGGAWIDATERSLTSWLVAPVERALDSARNATDPLRRAERYESLLTQLDGTEPGDRQADVVRECHTRLAELAEARDDLAAATDWMRRRHKFDDRDLSAATLYGQLLCRSTATATDGLSRLRDLAARFPRNPIVVPAYVRELIALDRCREALRVLMAADAEPRPSLWTVAWGDDVSARADLVARKAEHLLQLSAMVERSPERLRVLAPAHLDLVGVEAELTLSSGSEHVTAKATAAPRQLDNRTEFLFDLPTQPTGRSTILVQLPDRPYRSTTLAAPAGDKRMAALGRELEVEGALPELYALRDWRLAALRGAVAVELRETDGEFRPAGRFDVRRLPSSHAEFSSMFLIDVYPAAPVAEIRFVLPQDAGYRPNTKAEQHYVGGGHDFVDVTAATTITLVLPADKQVAIAAISGALF